MLIRKLALQNVRSFLDREELTLDGSISIIIGPNGGGKTNLLDTLVTMLRRYLLATRYPEQISFGNGKTAYQLGPNHGLTSLTLEKHATAPDLPQQVELTVSVSSTDLANMRRIKEEAKDIEAGQKLNFHVSPWATTEGWDVDGFEQGDLLTYVWKDGDLVAPTDKKSIDFLEYLQLFEYDNDCRSKLKREALQLPMIYLPVHRASAGFSSRVALSGFNDLDQKRQLDATNSRSGGTNIVSLAVGRLGKRYRALELDDNTSVKKAFYEDDRLKALTEALSELGYTWKLDTINPDTNEYDVILTKQGTDFAAGAASSGERELLTYLFAIYSLNVRDAVIVVDEPELHLHPRWQKILFSLFERLASETGNQFVLATHSPTFISPASIQYVSRVYIEDQKSRIIRLNSTGLPNAKHLFNIVNSQNNERIFFSDQVVLVEGLSDRMFFEKVFDKLGRTASRNVLEVISVGGKYLFDAYAKLLNACHVETTIIADLDYVEQIGDGDLKSLFKIDNANIKKDVIDNIGSMDAASLVMRIDEAMVSGNWQDAKDVWAYIKSRQMKLVPELSAPNREKLDAFIATSADAGVHILSKGALEAYLPEGYRNKNLEKLISLLEKADFWDFLPTPQRDEIETIGKAVLKIAALGEADKAEAA